MGEGKRRENEKGTSTGEGGVASFTESSSLPTSPPRTLAEGRLGLMMVMTVCIMREKKNLRCHSYNIPKGS